MRALLTSPLTKTHGVLIDIREDDRRRLGALLGIGAWLGHKCCCLGCRRRRATNGSPYGRGNGAGDIILEVGWCCTGNGVSSDLTEINKNSTFDDSS